jgi:GNAT superfamily N-acetyltransferase
LIIYLIVHLVNYKHKPLEIVIMDLKLRFYQTEEDYWRVRNFLREVFLLNDRLENSWHVARLDHWRYHFIDTCHVIDSVPSGIAIWETSDGNVVAVVTGLGEGEFRLHIHPGYLTSELVVEMLFWAEDQLAVPDDEKHTVYLPVFEQDYFLQEILLRSGYTKQSGKSRHWWRDLDAPAEKVSAPEGYVVRSMGGLDEHPARSWASWRAFHAEEPSADYDGYHSWYLNFQSAPLYRRDLDIVAVTETGEIASFCTVSYDDYTRSAVCVLVGTATEHWRRGLGKAVITEGMQRVRHLGCRRIFATAYDLPANALYSSVMQNHRVAETWSKHC